MSSENKKSLNFKLRVCAASTVHRFVRTCVTLPLTLNARDLKIKCRSAAGFVSRSGHFSSPVVALCHTARVRFHVLPDAGHWLHVDNPDGLRALVAPELVRLGKELREYSRRRAS